MGLTLSLFARLYEIMLMVAPVSMKALTVNLFIDTFTSTNLAIGRDPSLKLLLQDFLPTVRLVQ